MPLPIVFQAFFTLLSFFIMCLSLQKWRQPHMMYFTFLSIGVFFICVGILLEITSPTLEAAIVACKVQYIGAPFLGVLYYLFCRDYSSIPIWSSRNILLLLIFPVTVSLLVFTWPAQTLFYKDLSFCTTGVVNHLVITPGPLYFPIYIYHLTLAFLGAFTVAKKYHRKGSGRKHALAFFIASLLPIAAQVVKFAGFIPREWDIIPASMAAFIAFLLWYITRYRQHEWQSLGRELIVEHMKDGFILLDTRDRFLDANAMAKFYFPAIATVSIGMPVKEIEALPRQLFARDDSVFTIQTEEETLHLRSSRSPLTSGDRVLGTSILIYDDTENFKLMAELQQMATHDALTGLYNRGTFFAYARRDYSLSIRKNDPASVLMMDLDFFKKVNDRYGHAIGDKVLETVGAIIKERFRQTDICGRYGGEELCVWLPAATNEDAFIIADVIRRAVEQTYFDTPLGKFHITISIGISCIDYEHLQSFEEVLNQADSALYTAKNTGRNKIHIYQPGELGEISAEE